MEIFYLHSVLLGTSFIEPSNHVADHTERKAKFARKMQQPQDRKSAEMLILPQPSALLCVCILAGNTLTLRTEVGQ